MNSRINNDAIEMVRSSIRSVADFPKPGILFRDITPALQNSDIFRLIIDWFSEQVAMLNVEKLVAVESRGFFLAAPIADRLRLGLVLARKKGKLPFETVSSSYALEYGEEQLQMHTDSVRPSERIVIIDDVIATGGTLRATHDLCIQLRASPVAALTLIELESLKGREALNPLQCRSMISY